MRRKPPEKGYLEPAAPEMAGHSLAQYREITEIGHLISARTRGVRSPGKQPVICGLQIEVKPTLKSTNLLHILAPRTILCWTAGASGISLKMTSLETWVADQLLIYPCCYPAKGRGYCGCQVKYDSQNPNMEM